MADTEYNRWLDVHGSNQLPALVARVRDLFGWTQAQFADEVAVTRRTVVRWEVGAPLSDQELKRDRKHLERIERVIERAIMRRFTDTGPFLDTESAKAASWSLAYVYARGGMACLPAEGWQAALGIGESVLADVPVAQVQGYEIDVPRHWGFDVGAAAMAAVGGQRYRAPDDKIRFYDYYAKVAESFLLNLVRARIETVRWILGIEQLNKIVSGEAHKPKAHDSKRSPRRARGKKR